MVDNFNRIRGLLKFENPGDFYFLQIIQRKKDGGTELGGNNSRRLIKDYYITSLEKFDEIKDEVIRVSNENNARAYLRLNKRNYRTISLAFSESILEKVRLNQEFRYPLQELAHIVGKYPESDKDNRTWIVDIDDVEVDSPKISKVIDIINRIEPIGVEKIVTAIPTKSGIHLITKSFHTQKFNGLLALEVKEEGEVAILKDNPTILYVP